MQDSVYFELDGMTLNPKSTSTSNFGQDFEEWLYQSMCSLSTQINHDHHALQIY